jgi:hypothetical protein
VPDSTEFQKKKIAEKGSASSEDGMEQGGKQRKARKFR